MTLSPRLPRFAIATLIQFIKFPPRQRSRASAKAAGLLTEPGCRITSRLAGRG
jgi:hypothetical protein